MTGESWSEEARAKDPLSKNFKCWKVVLANPEVLAEPKYQLPPEPEFMSQPVHYEIPAYEDQGQTRGRKPTREPKNSQRKKRVAKGKKAKVDQGKNAVKVKKGKKVVKRSMNKCRKAKMARVRRAASAASLSDLPPAPSAGSRAKKRGKPRPLVMFLEVIKLLRYPSRRPSSSTSLMMRSRLLRIASRTLSTALRIAGPRQGKPRLRNAK